MADREIKVIFQGVDKLTPVTRQVTTGTQNMMRTAVAAAASFATGFAAAAAVAGTLGRGIVDLANQTMEYGLQVEDLSRILGANMEESSRLIQVADDARMSYGELTTAMRSAIQKGFTPTVEGLAQMAEQYRALPAGIERSRFLLERFGRSGLQMGRMLEMGADGIRQAGDEAERLGLVLGEDSRASIDRYYDAVDLLSDAWHGLAITVGNEVMPVLSLVMTRIALQIQYVREGENVFAAWAHAIVTADEALAHMGDSARGATGAVGGIGDGLGAVVTGLQDVTTSRIASETLSGLNEAYQNGQIPQSEYESALYLIGGHFLNLPSRIIDANIRLGELQHQLSTMDTPAAQGFADALAGILSNINTLAQTGLWSGTLNLPTISTGPSRLEQLSNIKGGQYGLNMTVPPGFPNDSYMLRASSGEHVSITPAGGGDVAAEMRGIRDEIRSLVRNLPYQLRDVVAQ